MVRRLIGLWQRARHYRFVAARRILFTRIMRIENKLGKRIPIKDHFTFRKSKVVVEKL